MGGAIPLAPYQCVESTYTVQYQKGGPTDHLGAGSFGEVRACIHNGTRDKRCVKTIEKTDWSRRSKVMSEIAILQAVAGQHPHIVEYVEYYEEWGMINLIFEFCPKGNVEQALACGKFFTGSEQQSARYSHQIIDALNFLKQMTIVHRDVKPGNLVFADEENLKLADFGTACYCTEKIMECNGTPSYYAPEMIQLPRGKGYDFQVDMWGMGLSLYAMLMNGRHAFMEDAGFRKNDMRSGTFQVGWTTSSQASDLLQWMLMPHPDQRITSEDALTHYWFYSYSIGPGTFAKTLPTKKYVLDSHGNWFGTEF